MFASIFTQIGMFVINNHITIAALAILARYLYKLYKEYVSTNDTTDDWFEHAMYYKMLRRHGSRHKDFVDRPIRFGKDRSMLYPKTDGGYTRKFLE